MWKLPQEVGCQKRKGQMQMWTEYEPWCAQIESWVLFGSSEKVARICSEEKT
jgi:hypothetical protein